MDNDLTQPAYSDFFTGFQSNNDKNINNAAANNRTGSSHFFASKTVSTDDSYWDNNSTPINKPFTIDFTPSDLHYSPLFDNLLPSLKIQAVEPTVTRKPTAGLALTVNAGQRTKLSKKQTLLQAIQLCGTGNQNNYKQQKNSSPESKITSPPSRSAHHNRVKRLRHSELRKLIETLASTLSITGRATEKKTLSAAIERIKQKKGSQQ